MTFAQRSLTFVLLALAATAARAQDPSQPTISPADDPQREMLELFGKVERRLRAIDELLSDAAAGETKKLADAKESGIGDLLRQTREAGQSVTQDIDRILELAQQMSQQSSSGQRGRPQNGSMPQSGSQSQGQSPLDRQGSREGERESTPSTPDKPGGKDGTKPDPKPGEEPSGNEPKADQKSNDEGANRGAHDPSKGATERTSGGADGGDRWGDLPERARDVFRSQGGGAMPARYRDWIDAYYRRLNKRP